MDIILGQRDMGLVSLPPQLDQPIDPAADKKMEAAAESLAKAFFLETLKYSGVEKAFSGSGTGGDSLSFVALDVLADQMVDQAPQLTQHFYGRLTTMGADDVR